MSERPSVLHRALRRPAARAGLVLIGLVVLAIIALPPFLPEPFLQTDILTDALKPPAPGHWLGTDHMSRDVLSRVVHGGRVSLVVALGAVTLAMTIGAAVGLVAGYYGGWLDSLLMRLVDGALAVPRLFVLLLLVGAVDRMPLALLIVVLGATGWFGTSRLVRGEVLRLRHADYVQAAEALGAGGFRIITRHLLPNAVGPLLVATTLAVGDVILLEAGLSFLGVGVQPPEASWGRMLHDAKPYLTTAPWTSLFPGAAIMASVLGVTLLGEGVREAYEHSGA